jgi:hypothetical protein
MGWGGMGWDEMRRRSCARAGEGIVPAQGANVVLLLEEQVALLLALDLRGHLLVELHHVVGAEAFDFDELELNLRSDEIRSDQMG